MSDDALLLFLLPREVAIIVKRSVKKNSQKHSTSLFKEFRNLKTS